MGPITTGLGQILFYFLDSADGAMNGVELRTIQDWLVKFDLQTVRGVTEVLSLGGFERQYQIDVRPEALLRYDLTVADVVAAVEANNANAGAQFLVENSEQYTVRAVGLAEGEHDLGDIVVKVVDGVPVRVRDIAGIEIGGAPRQGLATMNGQGEIVAGLVLKLIGANTNEVIGRVHDRLDRINETLPEGVEAIPYYDQSELVGAAVSTMTTALWQGALLVAIILFAFLRGWRPSLIVVASIPFSVGVRADRDESVRRFGQSDVAGRDRRRHRHDGRRGGGHGGERQPASARGRSGCRPAHCRGAGLRRGAAAAGFRHPHRRGGFPADPHARRGGGKDLPPACLRRGLRHGGFAGVCRAAGTRGGLFGPAAEIDPVGGWAVSMPAGSVRPSVSSWRGAGRRSCSPASCWRRAR